MFFNLQHREFPSIPGEVIPDAVASVDVDDRNFDVGQIQTREALA